MAEDQTLLGAIFFPDLGFATTPGCVADTLGENSKVEAASLPR